MDLLLAAQSRFLAVQCWLQTTTRNTFGGSKVRRGRDFEKKEKSPGLYVVAVGN